ncbi:MAG: type 4a pilus biogenesis protein PilO [Legionellales bacterium]|nr:type 4a pilus biogenesis protein PilO [Legionellales bacterium]
MALNINDLNNLDINNIGDWPLPIKGGILAIIFALIIGLGFYFLNLPQLDQLKQEQRKERELKTELDSKQIKAANVQAYRDQIVEIKKRFGTLLRKLPNKTEVPGLLEDISAAGRTSGLRVINFKPLPEKELGFYAELPIEMTVSGSFHQLGEFVSKLSALDRIVTVHDFRITVPPVDSKDKDKNIQNEDLTMVLIAKTYRYLEEGD